MGPSHPRNIFSWKPDLGAECLAMVDGGLYLSVLFRLWRSEGPYL